MQKLFRILLPGILAITLSTTAGADDGAPATIEEALQESGWTVHRTFAGDLYLFAPSENGAATAAEKTPTPTAKDPSTEEIDLQTLGNKLEAAGWKVERKSGGALELHPRETTTETTTRKEEPAPSPADEQWKQMQKQLNAAGWSATRESDGSLVLIPPGEPVQAAAPEEEAAPEKPADSMQTMQKKLKDTGWQVTENSDGSILFYPPKQQRGEKDTIQPARGHAPPADFKLPVTSWSQARALTQKWLKQQSPGNLKVGKIREIYEVYLVSIISGSRPNHRLGHQIAIRRSDGHIIVLN